MNFNKFLNTTIAVCTVFYNYNLANSIEYKTNNNEYNSNSTFNHNNPAVTLSITEQLDNRISYLNNLIKSTNNKKVFEKSNIVKEQMNLSIIRLKQLVNTLRVLNNMNVFPRILEFVRENSIELLNNKYVDFSPVFKPIEKTVNDSIHNIFFCKSKNEHNFDKLLKILFTEEELNIIEKERKENEKALEYYYVQTWLIFEALSMCPELGINRILKINNNEIECIPEGGLIDAIQTNDGKLYMPSYCEKLYNIGLYIETYKSN